MISSPASGCHCTPHTRGANRAACSSPVPVRARSTAPSGSRVTTSLFHCTAGASSSAVTGASSRSTCASAVQPTSSTPICWPCGGRRPRPPRATARSWWPRQMPSSGVPSADGAAAQLLDVASATGGRRRRRRPSRRRAPAARRGRPGPPAASHRRRDGVRRARDRPRPATPPSIREGTGPRARRPAGAGCSPAESIARPRRRQRHGAHHQHQPGPGDQRRGAGARSLGSADADRHGAHQRRDRAGRHRMPRT